MSFPIKVINLKKSVERRKNFSLVNKFIQHNFFDAVDGNSLPESTFNDPRLFVQPLPFSSKGVYGCALSHLSLWNYAIKTNRPVTIAEDDVIFRKDFYSESEKILSSLPEDWDIILWGWNFDSVLLIREYLGLSPAVMFFDPKSTLENIGKFSSQSIPSSAFKLDKCLGTPAYTISPNGARKFVKNCFPMKDFLLFFPVLNRNMANLGIDVAMNNIYRDVNSFVAIPPLVISENIKATSTIQAHSDKSPKYKSRS